MRVLVAIAVLVFINVVESYHGQRQCDQQSLNAMSQQCFGPLMALSQPGQQQQQQAFADADMAQVMCRGVNGSVKCFQNYASGCPNGGILSETLSGMFHYICGEGLDILLSESECWAHENFVQDIEYCTLEMERKISREGFNGWCRAVNSYMRCVSRRVTSRTQCTEAAGQFVRILFRRTMRPIARAMKCPLQTRAIRTIVDLLKKKK